MPESYTPGDFVVCTDVNSNGMVTGYMKLAPGFQPQPFVWQDGLIELLPIAKGWTAAYPQAVNVHGDVVGAMYAYPPDIFIPLKPPIAYLWSDGLPLSLGTLPGFDSSFAFDIDRFGRIVGIVWNSVTQAEESVLWQDGKIIKLDDLAVLQGSGLNYVSWIRAISDRGRILCHGSIGNGTLTVLLSPITASPADLSGDCAVNGHDLLMLLEEWNKPGSFADLDGDGAVNGADLGMLLLAWSAG
jgi:uncharacterized membrane protein